MKKNQKLLELPHLYMEFRLKKLFELADKFAMEMEQVPPTAPGGAEEDPDWLAHESEEGPPTQREGASEIWKEEYLHSLNPLLVRRATFMEAYQAITFMMYNIEIPVENIDKLAAARDSLYEILEAFDTKNQDIIRIVELPKEE